MTNTHTKIVIIGAGQAAAQAATSLRLGGFTGSITMIGDEPVPPYQRPPLSKAYMKGEMAEDRLFFKPAAWYEDQNIDLILSTKAISIDRAAKLVMIEHGGKLEYDHLIIATGSRPRALPVEGATLKNVHDLRSLTDVERIKPSMISGHHMVIIGAGYIGLEAAAVATQMGLNVTVLEMADRVLARVTSPVMSEFYAAEHRNKGVTIHNNARLEKLISEGNATAGKVAAAMLADGTKIKADIVLVGIGILPNQEIARDAGIECDNGIITDRDARSSDAHIYAAGDCARRPLVHYDRMGRLESVHNAIEQGKLAAAAILGKPRPAEDCPWFWSDQYDLKLQIAGLSEGYDDIILRGDPATRAFAAFYFIGDKLIAVDAVNSAPEFLVAKKLIIAEARPDKSKLADTTFDLRELLKPTA